MTTQDNGGPAFPADVWVDSDSPTIHNPVKLLGMTLRDYFAAKAMQGIYASNSSHNHNDEDVFNVVADAAYRQADAMLEARK